MLRAVLILCLLVLPSCGGALTREYEYEEELYLSLDGSATVNVNASVAALVALRGADLPTDPAARVDRERVRAFFSGPGAEVSRVSLSRRDGRRFAHVGIEVADLRELPRLAPFAWSTYRFERQGDVYEYRQVLGKSAAKDVGNVGWTGEEIVAFRMHIPSEIPFHNAPSRQVQRGNIVEWEQPLTARLDGEPMEIRVQMEPESILYSTLILFGSTIVAAAITFAVVIALVVRKGRQSAALGVALLLLAMPAAAQDVFGDALGEFTTLLSGTYGDEGAAARKLLHQLQANIDDWDKTLREYEANVVAIRPTASAERIREMHRTMGIFYFVRGRYDDAVRELSIALAQSPELQFQLYLGAAHDAAGRLDAAMRVYADAAALAPSDPIPAYLLAATALRTGTPVPAPALATLNEAVLRIAGGKYAAGQEPFLVTAVPPDNASDTPLFVPGWYAAAYASLERLDYRRASDALGEAAARDPLMGVAPPGLLRGAAALRAGRVDEAIARFAETVSAGPSTEAHRLLGFAYWLSADSERSVEQLEHAIRLDPANERARLMLVRVLEDLGDAAAAERQLRQAVDAIPSSAAARARLGKLDAAAGRTKDATTHYEEAARIGAASGEASLLIEAGELYRRELDAARAERAFARAIALQPNNAGLHRERGRALLQMDRREAAFVELAAALVLDAADYQSYLTMAEIHVDAGRHDEAARLLTAAIAVEPERPDAYYALANVLTRLGRHDEAKRHLAAFAPLQEKTLEEQRQRIELSTARLRAAMLLERGDSAAGVEAWARIVDRWPNTAAHHAGLAAALAREGQLAAAAERYEHAMRLNPDGQVARDLAALYERLGKPDAAAKTRARLAQARQAAFGIATR